MIGRSTAPILLVCLTLTGVVAGANVAYAADSSGEAYVEYNGTHLDIGNAEPTPFGNREMESAEPPDANSRDDSHFSYDTALESYVMESTYRLIDAMVRYTAWVADSTATVLFPVSDVVPRSVTMGILNLLTLFGFGFMGYQQYRHYRQERGGSR
jgi:hypothetical protein